MKVGLHFNCKSLSPCSLTPPSYLTFQCIFSQTSLRMITNPPTSVPHLNLPVASLPPSPDKPPTPYGSGLSSTNSPTRSSFQSQGDNNTPAQLSQSTTYLRTPPTSESLRQDGGYFSFRGTSPGRSSGGSFHSSDTGHTGCSYNCSDLLSPPPFQGDDDKPPYRPRSESTDSLSMGRRMRRVQTTPNDKKIKIKRRHRRGHNCRQKKDKGDDGYLLTCWSRSTCQIAPTAPAGHKVLCYDHTGHTSRLLPTSTQQDESRPYGRPMGQSIPRPTNIVVARRWSSVEVGNHHFSPETSVQSKRLKARASTEEDVFIPRNIDFPYQISKPSCNTSDGDIVRVVRELLTIHKLGPDRPELGPPVEPPLSITLRRASRARSIRRSPIDQECSSAVISGQSTPLAGVGGYQYQAKATAATYLITSEDIDSITELIVANLKRKHPLRPRSGTSAHFSRSSRSLSNPDVGLLSSNMSSADPIVLGTDVHESEARVRGQPGYLQVAPDRHRPLQRTPSNRSVHEVLWNGQASSPSSGSAASEENVKTAILCETSVESAASPEIPPSCKEMTLLEKDKGDAFDPNNPRASISEWSCRLQQNYIPTIITSPDLGSNDLTLESATLSTEETHPTRRSSNSTPPKERMPRVRPFPRYAASEEKLQDVVSFPPLSPRKATNDWFSPLPGMETISSLTTHPLTNSRSLYDLGVDVTIGPSGSTTPKAPFTSWVRSAEAFPPQSLSIDFKTDYGFGRMSTSTLADKETRRRSVVKPHPKASARTGQSSAMGSSIGNHSREKRQSSTPYIQRVRTIDNIHKGERETPSTRWRPPSICPPRITSTKINSSPTENEDAEEERVGERLPEIVTRLQRSRSGITDRLSLIQARCPQISKVDCAGIYGTITGTLRRSIAAASEGDTIQHVCNDCAKDSRQPSVDWIG